jgi:hypothetical protein
MHPQTTEAPAEAVPDGESISDAPMTAPANTSAEPHAEPHAATSLFPPLGDDEFAALVEDIREYGQRVPIVLVDGVLVDGRHRLRACEQLGIEPKVRHLTLAEAVAAAAASALCFTRRRIKFERPDGRRCESPAQGQVFFFFGAAVNKFADVFGQIGFVIRLPVPVAKEIA